MPSSDLPLPEQWGRAQSGRWTVITAGSLVLGPLMLTGGLNGLDSENPEFAGAFAPLGALLLLSVAARTRRRTGAPVSTDGKALRIGLSRTGLVLGLATTVLGGGGAALFAVGTARLEAWVWCVVTGAIAIGAAAALVVRLVRGLSVGELSLSPEEVRLRIDARDTRVAWDDVTTVSAFDEHDRYGTIVRRRLVLDVRSTGRGIRYRLAQASETHVEMPCHRIDLDEVVLYHLLRFYLDHPEARAELAGPAAVTRLRERAFPA